MTMLGFEETASIDQLVKNTNCGEKKSTLAHAPVVGRKDTTTAMHWRFAKYEAAAPTDTERIHERYTKDTARIQKRYTKDTETIQKGYRK